LLPLLIAEKSEMARDVWRLPQWVHGAAELALLIGRSFSKVAWHSVQWYSYIGMVLSLISETFR
jgi:hypothetical protein